MHHRPPDLYLQTADKVISAITYLPSGVTSLDLSSNNLGSKTGAELAKIFVAIPAGVTSLNLSINQLYNKTGAELAQAFTVIPARVTSLNLRYNHLHKKTFAELAKIFAAIPLRVKKVNLGNNNLFTGKTRAQIDELLNSIPADVNGNKHLFDLNYNGESDCSRALVADVTTKVESSLEEHLSEITNKETVLRTAGHIYAAYTAKNLHEKLSKSYKETFPKNIEQFKQECKEAINEARPQLETHRGWKLTLSYLMLAITGVGALLVVADVAQKYSTGKHFSFFQTDSAQKVYALEEILNKVPMEYRGRISDSAEQEINGTTLADPTS